MSRLALAHRLYRVARERGHRPSLRLCYRIVAAARDTHTSVARLAALVEKESGFSHVFGHDAGGWFPGEPVTEEKYHRLVAHLRTNWSGANGVGYTQVTYPPFLFETPGLWRPKVNLRWGAKHLASLVAADGVPDGLNAYNGDPTGAYGRDLEQRCRDYAKALR